MGRDGKKGKGGGRGHSRLPQIANEEELMLREQQIATEKEERIKRRAEAAGEDAEGGEEGVSLCSFFHHFH